VGNGLKHDILKTFTKSILAITGQVNMYLSHIDQVYATYLSGVSSVGTLSVILVQGVLNMRVMEARFDLQAIICWIWFLITVFVTRYMLHLTIRLTVRHSINLTLRLFFI